ncbi:MAG: cell wall-binding repeat-containing protein [Peptostreptococcus sp.]|uniref:cell wall-binding repeat-containing protein n=1 Tax=Peptostreptococcus sp. TaxID=1262 RepID=UPI001CB09EDB|nr:cell wall-binding repeat-containing protein [Peptostreptococcus sp.]MBF1057292.1 cell wall-binding repeat-containing protein [Peptostreptococcus sp.]
MKKQIAVLMAAATAVTTVAPVLASADTILHENVSIGEVEAKIATALADKYASDKEDGINLPGPDAVKGYENSKYAVILDVEETLPSVQADKEKLLKTYKESYGIVLASETIYKALTEATPATGHVRYVVTDAAKVKNLIEKRMSSPKVTTTVTPTVTPTSVLIVDKGVKDNKSTYTTTNKHYVAGTVSTADADTQVSLKDIDSKEKIDVLAGLTDSVTNPAPISFIEKVTSDVPGNPTKVTIELKSGKKIEVGVNSEALDFTAPKAEKQALTLDQVKNSQAVANQVVDFAKIANVGGVSRTLDLPLGETHEYKLEDVEVHEIAVPTVYTKAEGYSKAGADLINPLIRAKRNDGKLSDASTTTNNAEFSFNYKGVNYALATDAGLKVPNVEKAKLAVDTANAKIDVAGDGYVLRLNVRVLDKNDKDRFKTLQFKFEGKTQQDLVRVLNDLKGDNEVVVGKFVKLAGSDRAATAVEVSKERFGYKEADSVVVVGANALIDGLSAAPLAAAKNAPVLIAGKNGLDNGSLAEIERACKDLSNKTVYIVGGENSVPYAAKKQLEDKFGAVVVRLAGDDRYDTSLEVDHRLFKDGQVSTTRFVVGGNGAADAMSASAVAAKKTAGKVSPILVVRKDGIKATTRTYLAGKVVQAYVVGGTSTASTQVFKDIEKVINQTPAANNVADNKVKRLSGDDRYATNLAVINEFYANPKANGLAVVSGKTQYLVDAQTAGAFAADRGLAVLLTADKLNKAQEDTLANGVLKGLKTNIYQVGGVVSNDVMKSVVDILGL